MAWKRALAYKIFDRVIIMPVFLIPKLYPVSGEAVYDGSGTDPEVADAVLEALRSSQTPPSDFEMDRTNKRFLKAVRCKSLRLFHRLADSVSIEGRTSAAGEEILFQPLARSISGGFEASALDPLIISINDRKGIQAQLSSALELAMLAEPKSKQVLPLRQSRLQMPEQ